MIGNNSCGTHSLISGKTVDNVVTSCRVLLYDGTELTVGPTSEAELDAIIREGGRRGEMYVGAAIDPRHGTRRRSAPAFRRFRAACPATTWISFFRKTASTSRARSSAPKARARSCSSATLRLIESPQHRVLVGLGYPDAFAAADHVPQILETVADRPGRLRREASSTG